MGTKSKWEYFRAIYQRYRKASFVKTQIPEEFVTSVATTKVRHCQAQRSRTQFKPPARPAAFAHLQPRPGDPAAVWGHGLPLASV